MKNARVLMLHNDGFGKKGWTGTISDSRPWSSDVAVRIRWDNGKSYLHDKRNLKRLDGNEILDPNLAFSMRKEG